VQLSRAYLPVNLPALQKIEINKKVCRARIFTNLLVKKAKIKIKEDSLLSFLHKKPCNMGFFGFEPKMFLLLLTDFSIRQRITVKQV
jgi:hypothetical protein